MNALTIIGRKVIVSREGVLSFNRGWPNSELSGSCARWFEFDERGDLVDCDVPAEQDGAAAGAMAHDCLEYLENGTRPDWAP